MPYVLEAAFSMDAKSVNWIGRAYGSESACNPCTTFDKRSTHNLLRFAKAIFLGSTGYQMRVTILFEGLGTIYHSKKREKSTETSRARTRAHIHPRARGRACARSPALTRPRALTSALPARTRVRAFVYTRALSQARLRAFTRGLTRAHARAHARSGARLRALARARARSGAPRAWSIRGLRQFVETIFRDHCFGSSF